MMPKAFPKRPYAFVIGEKDCSNRDQDDSKYYGRDNCHLNPVSNRGPRTLL